MKRFCNLILTGLLLCLLALPAGAKTLPLKEGVVLGHEACLEDVSLLTEAQRHTEDEIRTTAKGLEFLKRHEGYRAEPYGDYSQTSIGYGTSTRLAAKYGFSTTYLSEEDAHDLLVCVVWEFEQSLNDFLASNHVAVTTAQYDALVSFTYNLGTGWMSGCRFSRALIHGGYTPNELASAMGIWCHAGNEILDGLVNRRIDEITLFLYGLYETEAPLFCTLIYQGEGWIDNDIEFFLKGEPYGGFTDTAPPAEGYAFDGWYTGNGDRIEADDIVEQSHVVTVRWREIYGYEVTALEAQDRSGNGLDGIPDGGFYLSAEIYKSEGTGSSVLLLVTYTDRGQLLDTYFLQADVPEGTAYSLGVWVPNRDGRVGECQAFVLESLSSAVPLCKAAVLN